MSLRETGTRKMNLKEQGCPSLPEGVCLSGLEWLHIKLNRQVKFTAGEFKYLRYLTLLGNHKMFEQRNKKEKALDMGKMTQEMITSQEGNRQ